MASNFSALPLFFFFVFFAFPSLHAATAAEPYVVIEDGYTVTTVIDGHKIGISPYAVSLKPGSSNLVVLDYSGSAFYTVPFPVSKEIVTKRLSGTGDIGYVDGEPGSVRFNKPRSFAVDLKGNVYVADKSNNVIRKINSSGVTTTISGAKSRTGRDDGPVQNASFSNDFELVFVAERCALLVSDHGNQLVRQIELKPEDCRRDSGSSGHGMSAVSLWSVVVGVACVVGFIVGLAARPYILAHQGVRINCSGATWKLCLIDLAKVVQILCFAIRSAAANFSLVCALLERLFLVSLSLISTVFRIDHLVPQAQAPQTRALRKERAPLLDSNCSSSSSEMVKISEKYANQLKDLISFDESLDLKNPTNAIMVAEGEEDLLSECCGSGKVDEMIETNLMHFTDEAKETIMRDGRSSLVKRR